MEINERNAKALNEHQKIMDDKYTKLLARVNANETTIASLLQRVAAAEQLIKIKFTGTGPSVR